MVAGKEEITASIMDGRTPESILQILVQSEQMESALYAQIARAVPAEALRRIILHRARHERRQAAMLAELASCFGAAPAGPPVFPMTCSAAGEKKEND